MKTPTGWSVVYGTGCETESEMHEYVQKLGSSLRVVEDGIDLASIPDDVFDPNGEFLASLDRFDAKYKVASASQQANMRNSVQMVLDALERK